MLPMFRTVASLRDQRAVWRGQGEPVALVPTMGALHEGHLTLVRTARAHAARVVVSIFVNPTQFGPNEDFAAYPRQEAEDLSLLAAADADALFAPTVSEVYPAGFATNIHVTGISEGLCGNFRPGHFDGVATIVAKLLIQAAPDVALFGEKDYQQLQVIRRVATDLNLPVTILGVPTVRESDGLAMSSRNAYLTSEQRAIAPTLHHVLQDSLARLRAGDAAAPVLAAGIARLLAAGFASVDYLELRAADGLAPLAQLDRPARLLVAARLGGARLIDNIAAEQGGP